MGSYLQNTRLIAQHYVPPKEHYSLFKFALAQIRTPPSTTPLITRYFSIILPIRLLVTVFKILFVLVFVCILMERFPSHPLFHFLMFPNFAFLSIRSHYPLTGIIARVVHMLFTNNSHVFHTEEMVNANAATGHWLLERGDNDFFPVEAPCSLLHPRSFSSSSSSYYPISVTKSWS